MAECAIAISSHADRVRLIGDSLPFHMSMLSSSAEIEAISAPQIWTDATGEGAPLRSLDSLSELQLAEAALSSASAVPTLLWAHYLFPYARAALLAADLLKERGVANEVWLTPAGSDIWQIAPQLPAATRTILRSPSVSRILTYSSRFAREVESAGDLEVGTVDVFAPAVGSGFRLRSLESAEVLRSKHGIDRDALVMSVHGNMRPVKNVGAIVRLAEAVAILRGSEETWLLLAGPPYSVNATCTNLRVRHFGLLDDLADFLCMADVEVNLSRHDSFNMSIAEAMAAGVLPLTSDVAGVAEHVERSGMGLTVPLPHTSIEPPNGPYAVAVKWLLTLGASSLESRYAMRIEVANYASEYFSRGALRAELAARLRSSGL